MDPQVSSSFIPKKTLTTGTSRGVRGTGLVVLIAILIFVMSLVAAAGAFVYQGFLKQSIASKGKSLELNEKAFDPSVIQELIRTDSRINEAGKLLDAHIAPSALFAFLSQQTLGKVQFIEFGYTTRTDGTAEIRLKGVADSFSTVALQSDQFGASKSLKDVVFSDVNAGEQGKIGFSVAATIVPALISYSNALSVTPSTPVEVEEDTTSSSSATTTAP